MQLNHYLLLLTPVLTSGSLLIPRRALQQDASNATATQQQHNWWEFSMPDPVLDEVALYYMGHAWFQGSDVAECLETMYRNITQDPWSWTRAWRQTAERLQTLALATEESGMFCNIDETLDA